MRSPWCRRGHHIDPCSQADVEQGAALRTCAAAVRDAVDDGHLPPNGQVDVNGVGEVSVAVLLAIADLTSGAAAVDPPDAAMRRKVNTDRGPLEAPSQARPSARSEPGLVAVGVDVLEGAPVLTVVHSTVGCWTLHGATSASTEPERTTQAASWTEILARDPGVNDVAGLAPGWTARRDSQVTPWRRSPG